MNPIFTKAWAYRIAAVWLLLFSVNALGTAVLAAFSNANWADMDVQGRVIICVAILVNWTGTLMAFFSKAAQKYTLPETPAETKP